MKNCYISNRASIGKNVIIGNNVTIYGECEISDNCLIGDNVSVGFPTLKETHSLTLEDESNHLSTIDALSINPTYIEERVRILSNSVIYSGVKIGDNTHIFEHSRIGAGTSIGRKCKIRYGAQIYTDVSIGDNCIIAGFCCSRSKIGSHSSMLGNLVHKYTMGWVDGLKESAPIIDNHVIVGYKALVIGDIKISKYVYVAADAIVTKEIPSHSIVVGNCEIYNSHKWRGKLDLNALFELEGGEDNGRY